MAAMALVECWSLQQISVLVRMQDGLKQEEDIDQSAQCSLVLIFVSRCDGRACWSESYVLWWCDWLFVD
jgi:hypothetical protein